MAQQKDLSNELNIVIEQFVLIENNLWSGKNNKLKEKTLKSIKEKYKSTFNYMIHDVKKEMVKFAERRCREEHANCILAKYATEMMTINHSCMIISDIDEILDNELIKKIINLSNKRKTSFLPIFVKQKTCWFTSKFVYNNNWPGRSFFL